MNRISSISLAAALAAVIVCRPAAAQPLATPGGGRIAVDGVAAIVGNEVILQSDVIQQMALLSRQNKSVDPRDAKVQNDVLNALIDEKLVLTRAIEDSVVVADDEISRAVDYQVSRILSQFGGSVDKVEKAYGMSMDKIRRESREIVRQQFLTERMRQRRFADLKPTENDVQEFYRKYRDSIPQVPEQVELETIVLLSKPSADARAATFALAHRIIDSLHAGGDFADFARRYSADPGSAQNGGDNGYVEKGKFVAEYETAARKLGNGEISEPVESSYGVHIIQVLDRKGDATRSRHILLRITQSGTERDSMIARLNELRSRALAGENFSDLARKYSEDDDSRGLGGALGRLPLDQIPADSKDEITRMKEGEITAPKPVVISPTESGFQIIRLARRIPPHALDPQEDRAQLERLATLYKQNDEYLKWIAELRQEIFWEIKTTN